MQCYNAFMSLTCPICGKTLQRSGNTAVCQNHHSFDYAKQGYLNLLIRQSKAHGDNQAMVRARTGFLNTGAYAFLREELQNMTVREKPAVLADLGCGEGYYTSAFNARKKYGFDMSKEAVRHAAGSDKSTQYVIASMFHLPLSDQCCDMAITCFAPFAGTEVQRILKTNGLFVFVSPGPDHLIELKRVLYETPYENVIKDLDTPLVKEQEYQISSLFHVDHQSLMNLFEMTPYAHHTKESDQKKMNDIREMDLTAQFVIRTYRRK